MDTRDSILAQLKEKLKLNIRRQQIGKLNNIRLNKLIILKF